MENIRGAFPNVFDKNITEMVYDNFAVAPLMLNHVNVKDDLDGTDSITIADEALFGAMPVKLESEDIALDAPKELWSKKISHLTFALAFAISREMVKDNKKRKVEGWAQALGSSARETANVYAANLLNLGFSTTWGDGKVLFATDHPLEGGASQSNTPAAQADLTPAVLNAALYALQRTVNHRGLRQPITGLRLIVPPEGDKLAAELTGSPDSPQTTDRAINYYKGRVSYTPPNPYLTDTNAWYLQAAGHGLSFFWREMFSAGSYYKNGNMSLVHFAMQRFMVAVETYRGMYGSSGTA